MPLTAPNLDDRHFQDIMDEARTLIPRFCPEWTDHNLSDPGIALNRGLARWARGDSHAARPMLGTAVAEAGGYLAACRLIALAPEDSLDRFAGLAPEDLTLRARIRSVLRHSTAVGGEEPRAGGRTVGTEPSLPSPPVRGIGKHLYWIE